MALPARARVGPLDPQRRHTLHFLSFARQACPVHIDTEVDMRAVLDHRDRAPVRTSVVSYVMLAGARALARHPEANAAVVGRLRPRVARYPTVDVKLALDKRLDGTRVVITAPVRDVGSQRLPELQRTVDRLRDTDAADLPEAGAARALMRAPFALGALGFRLALSRLRARPRFMGTLAVSSLGHRPVDGFHSYGGTAVTLGVGRVRDLPRAEDGAVAIVPTMRLSLTFDHRVIDGAVAADVLADITHTLEDCRDLV
ncbi:2-oxo acid dehydrogenase subunit E2 [Streptomonospora salina]|uniref:Pyruvate/2-oxoglutarate dehydrogenase complex dihydrolipoamide acyltransferase (E2) component n=1 Tax=Streptomonospora salina TaxID=104205 RepID=A0A841EAF1_9ACTN|nr:2-oxo acid dehydrogenase subunit E2 [Streptomonospora salina]MBB6001007.1 pyruvate/2-oxoglutarate dehydrogenase complex dihydrolipoamide acyltransferase (E2) component [Streptomonospora salina]